MKRRRVKITGLGFVTPAGVGRDAFYKGILEPVSRVNRISRFPDEAGPFVGAEIRRFSIADYGFEGKWKRVSRHTQFALVAAQLALCDAGLEGVLLAKKSPAVVTGTSLMDSDVINRTIENVVRKGPRYGLSRVVYQGPVSSVATAITEIIGGGRALTIQSACCSGSDAVGHGVNLIANGESDLVVCGGTEAPLFYHPMLELKLAGLSPNTAERPNQLCRPFDLWRTTGVIGEGACMLVLEPEQSARPGYAYIGGYSYATDHPEEPCSGLYEAIRLCISGAGKSREEIDMISAWGPGHRTIDQAEARVLRRYFGDRIESLPAGSIKGAIGNPFAAAGAVQIGCTALGLKLSFVPPTVNWQTADPECRLNLSNRARHIGYDTAIVNSHGLSGTNSCLLLERCA